MSFNDQGTPTTQITQPSAWSLTGLVNGLMNISTALSRIATVLGNSYVSTSSANVWTGTQTYTKPVVLPTFTVGALPAAVQGAVAFVSDSTQAYSAGALGAVVAGGGTAFVAVYADGTHFRIG